MIHYIESLLKKELMETTGLTYLGIERAHRALGPKPAENAPPRSIVIKFLKYSIKDKIINAAWRKTIIVDGRKVFFDHDYATAVMEKWREYQPIKKLLKERGIRFHTPMTRMRVFLHSGTVVYGSADQASEDLRARDFSVPPIPKRREATQSTFSWEQVKERRSRSLNANYRQRVREKLRDFHHRPAENAAKETSAAPM